MPWVLRRVGSPNGTPMTVVCWPLWASRKTSALPGSSTSASRHTHPKRVPAPALTKSQRDSLPTPPDALQGGGGHTEPPSDSRGSISMNEAERCEGTRQLCGPDVIPHSLLLAFHLMKPVLDY